jgi:hypothetical protein
MTVFDEMCYKANGNTCTQTCVSVTHLCLLATLAVRGSANFKYYLTTLPIAKSLSVGYKSKNENGALVE